MKRHEVMDLFHGDKNTVVDEPWNDVKEGLPSVASNKVKVKLADESETDAYYYSDYASWLSKFNLPTSYFWACISREPLMNVTHWKHMK